MLRIALVALAASAATAAAAQTTSQCQWVGRVWTCQETPSGPDWSMLQNMPNPSSAAAQGFAQGQAMAAASGDSWGAFYARSRARKVGKMLAKGDCFSASQYALKKGDGDLLAFVESRCGR